MTFASKDGLRQATQAIERQSGGFCCPACDSPTAVIDSRQSSSGGVRRRRECTKCGARTTTHEVELGKYHALVQQIEGLAAQVGALVRDLGAEREP